MREGFRSCGRGGTMIGSMIDLTIVRKHGPGCLRRAIRLSDE